MASKNQSPNGGTLLWELLEWFWSAYAKEEGSLSKSRQVGGHSRKSCFHCMVCYLETRGQKLFSEPSKAGVRLQGQVLDHKDKLNIRWQWDTGAWMLPLDWNVLLGAGEMVWWLKALLWHRTLPVPMSGGWQSLITPAQKGLGSCTYVYTNTQRLTYIMKDTSQNILLVGVLIRFRERVTEPLHEVGQSREPLPG